MAHVPVVAHVPVSHVPVVVHVVVHVQVVQNSPCHQLPSVKTLLDMHKHA